MGFNPYPANLFFATFPLTAKHHNSYFPTIYPCTSKHNKITYVADTGWGNSGVEGTNIHTVKLFTVSPTRWYQARFDPAIRRISDQGSRAVIYRVTLIKLK